MHNFLYNNNANVMDAANEFGVGLYKMWGKIDICSIILNSQLIAQCFIIKIH